MHRTFIKLGSLLAFLSVFLGAFGAHKLQDIILDAKRMDTFHTAAQYQMTHALGLILIGLFAERLGNSKQVANVRTAGWLLFAGVIIFSGSLYTIALTGIRVFGALAPIGGLCFMVGWILLAVAASKSPE